MDCDTNCFSCEYSATNCTNCSGGKILNIGLNEGRCCLVNEYLDSFNNCQTCSENCYTCSNFDNCLSCYGNLVISTINSQSICNCPDGSYLQSLKNCEMCNKNCQSCNKIATNCTSCSTNLALHFNETTNLGKCVCSLTNTFYNESSAKCQKCDLSCDGCTGPLSLDCLKCANNYELLEGICVPICNNSQYFDNSSKSCHNCSSLCQSCFGPFENNCSICLENYYLMNSTCVSYCGSTYFQNYKEKICVPCDKSCLECNDTNKLSCLKCYNGMFLMDSECVVNCPQGYLENAQKNLCEKIKLINIFSKINEIDNPYKFLLVIYSAEEITLNISKSLKQEVYLKITITMEDNRDFDYLLTPSGINLTTYILQLTYPDKKNTATKMNVNLINTNTIYYHLVNENMSIDLLNDHNCNEQTEYFDIKVGECLNLIKIDYSWEYTELANVILLKFNVINSRIKNAILNESFFNINIDNFKEEKDYTIKISEDFEVPLSFKLLLNYNKPVIGGAYLHLSYNQSIYNKLSFENNSIFIKNQYYDIKLSDYYFLSETEQKAVNNSGKLSKGGSEVSTATVIVAIFFFPGSSFAMRGLMLLNVIQLLKYVDISYPPQAVAIFKDQSQKLFLNDKLVEEISLSNPKYFKFYNVSLSPLNNLLDDLLQLIFFTIIGVTIQFIHQAIGKYLKKSSLIEYFFLISKSATVWSLVIMMMISKYLKISVCILIYTRYKEDYFNSMEEFFFFLICFLYMLLLIPHFTSIITKINHLKKILGKKQIEQSICSPQLKFNKVLPTNSEMFKNNAKDENPSDLIYFSKASMHSTVFPQKNFYDSEKPIKISQLERNKISVSPFNNPEKPVLFLENAGPKKSVVFHLQDKNSKKKENTEEKNDLKDEPMTAITPYLENRNELISEYDGQMTSKTNETPMTDLEIEKYRNHFKTNGWKKYIITIVKGLLLPCNYFRDFLKFVFTHKNHEEFCFKYRILVKGMSSKLRLSNYYFTIDLVRFLLLAILVSFSYDNPMAEICLMEVVSCFFLIFIILTRPFENKIEMLLCLINESLINCAYLAAILLALLDRIGYSNSDLRMQLGWVIVFSYLIMMYSLFMNIFQKMVRSVFVNIRTIFKKLLDRRRINN